MQWGWWFYHKPCYTFFPEEPIAPGHPNSESMILLTQLPVSMMGMATPELGISGHLSSPQNSNLTGSISAMAFALIKPNLTFFSPMNIWSPFLTFTKWKARKIMRSKRKIKCLDVTSMWSVYMDNNIADCAKVNHFSMQRSSGFKQKYLLFK